MKYSNGFLRSFIGNKWFVETKENHLIFKSHIKSGKVDYASIKRVFIENGLISDSIRVESDESYLNITDFSASDALNIKKDIIKHIKETIADGLIVHHEQLKGLNSQLNSFLKKDIYIAQSDVRNWLNKIPDIGAQLSHPYLDISYLPSGIASTLTLLNDIKNQKSKTLQKRNQTFVQKEMVKYKWLFDKLEKNPLTEEQKKAAIIDEDCNLLIAAAGSGKSSTIIAKVNYILEKKLAKPSEILVLAYNKDAQLEIEQRLSKQISKNVDDLNFLKAKTFHSYGLDIITKVTGKKPSIAKIATVGKTTLNSMFSNYIDQLCHEHTTFLYLWTQFLITAKRPLPDLKKIETQNDYDNFLKQTGAQLKSSSFNTSLRLTTINNKEVNSLEELRIFNWLVINGVNFEYEKKYEISTSNQNYRQYYPDFYYPEANLYHEHFALDKSGKPPEFMKDYLEGVVWKRQIHQENETNLIETLSCDFDNEDMFDELKEKLISYGVKFNPLTKQELDKMIEVSFDPKRDVEVFIIFLRHFKANDFSIEEVEEKFKTSNDKYRSNLFLKLFKIIYSKYQQELDQKKEIDFEDQINLASKYISERKILLPWKYILVDEFQDISQDRKRFIQSILSQNDSMKLFAVGDDWQSIYRFSGADINVMTNFQSHFGITSQNNLTNTFRSYQGIVDVASNFIQKNSNQIKKHIKSQKDIRSNQVVIREYSNELKQEKILSLELDRINKIARDKKTKLSVFILARYNHDLPENKNKYIKNFNLLNIQFKSIHASKGLEADYVMVLNLNNDKYGFPSLLEDDPLISLIMPKAETYPYAEERRLFYVALTRAKRGVFLFYKKYYASKFIKEILSFPRVSFPIEIKSRPVDLDFKHIKSKPSVLDSECPQCRTGTLIIKSDRAKLKDPFLSCSDYPVCKYSESNVPCPKCKSGKVVRRVNKKNNEPFYTCERYECSYKWRNKTFKKYDRS